MSMELLMNKNSGSTLAVYAAEYSCCMRTFLNRKPHRKVASGLKLLSQTVKTVKSSSGIVENGVREFREDDADVFEEVPYDIFIHEILAKLPIKDLILLKSVSKVWYSIISSYEFANVHFKTSLLNYHPSSPVECLFIQVANKFHLFYLQEEDGRLDYCLLKLEPNFDYEDKIDLHVVGSCNGLICLADSSSSAGYFYIWNPLTYLWYKYSDPCCLSCNCMVSWGFAYASSIDDYMVVKIVQDYDTLETVVLEFSLRTQEWKTVNDHELDQSVSLAKTNPGVFINDTIYWHMVVRGPFTKHIVMGYKLSQGKFGEIPGLVPRRIRDYLCVVGGCLSLCTFNACEETHLSIVKRLGEVETVRLASCSDKWSCSGLVGFTRTGKCFMVSKAGDLALIDPSLLSKEHHTLATFEQARKPCILSYVPSLISPYANK